MLTLSIFRIFEIVRANGALSFGAENGLQVDSGFAKAQNCHNSVVPDLVQLAHLSAFDCFPPTEDDKRGCRPNHGEQYFLLMLAYAASISNRLGGCQKSPILSSSTTVELTAPNTSFNQARFGTSSFLAVVHALHGSPDTVGYFFFSEASSCEKLCFPPMKCDNIRLHSTRPQAAEKYLSFSGWSKNKTEPMFSCMTPPEEQPTLK